MREIQYYVNPKTRLCQAHNGPAEYLKQRAAEAERNGFTPATEAEVDAFRKVTHEALDAGWNPDRMSYDTWCNVRTDNPETDHD